MENESVADGCGLGAGRASSDNQGKEIRVGPRLFVAAEPIALGVYGVARPWL